MSQHVKVIASIGARWRENVPDADEEDLANAGLWVTPTSRDEAHWAELGREAAETLHKVAPRTGSPGERVMFEIDYGWFHFGLMNAARSAFMVRWRELCPETDKGTEG